MSQQVTVVNSFDGTMHVHATGCADLKRRDLKRSDSDFDLTITSQADAINQIWEDFISEWEGDMSTGEDNTKFYACVTV